MKYDYKSKSIDPRYGVTNNMSRNFSEASSGVFAWFADLRSAVLFAELLLTMGHNSVNIWDLNNGVEVLEWATVMA